MVLFHYENANDYNPFLSSNNEYENKIVSFFNLKNKLALFVPIYKNDSI